MLRSRDKMLALLVIFSILMMASLHQAHAQDPFTKLGRGVANVLTGWVEITKEIYKTSVEENPFTGLTAGLARGTGAALRRTGAGLYETVTFPFPGTENYSPTIDPEYVF